MSKAVKIRKGLNIRLQGSAEKFLTKASMAEKYAVKPSDFKGLTLRLCVKQGDTVKAGTPVLYDKSNPAIKIASPVSGVVETVNRGDRRKLLEVVIKPDAEQIPEKFNVSEDNIKSREQIINLMLEAGLWAFVIQRPYGTVARPDDKPKAIFISGFDSAPLAVDMDFVLAGREDFFQKGIDILAKLTDGKVHLGLSTDDYGSKLNKIKNAEITIFSGKHPAGNVGIQIHHVSPVNKGETVWTLDAQHVAMLGRFFTTGTYNADRVVALCGPAVKRPQYMHIIAGASISSISEYVDHSVNVRYINGDVLTGSNIGKDGYAGFYGNRISIIPEGDRYEFLGWAMPRLKKFSTSRSYFSWLTPCRSYVPDTNLNGGERAFVVTNQYEKVLPMDIYPVYLLKAILAGNIEKMEQLGIYEVIEEDLALCEFVCTSKIEVQSILRKGIDLMIKEMS